MGGLGMRRKGLEDLNVYRNRQKQGEKVREDLNVPRGWGACEGQALALRLRRRAAQAPVRRGPSRRDRFLILSILFLLAILLQTR